jgi:hypothetical protein
MAQAAILPPIHPSDRSLPLAFYSESPQPLLRAGGAADPQRHHRTLIRTPLTAHCSAHTPAVAKRRGSIDKIT